VTYSKQVKTIFYNPNRLHRTLEKREIHGRTVHQ